MLRIALSCLSALLGLATLAQAQSLAPSFSQPTDRYLHGVFGENFEYAQLNAFGQSIRLDAPEVFEDRKPRLVDLNLDGKPEILAVVAQAGQGAGLALFGLDPQGRLSRLASGPKIGRGNRWQAPLIGQADVTGNGVAEIASILTPHINPRLQILSWQGNKLVLVSTRQLPAGSNHAYGSMMLDNAFWCETSEGVVFAVTRDPRRSDTWLLFDGLAARGPLPTPSRSHGGQSEARRLLGCPPASNSYPLTIAPQKGPAPPTPQRPLLHHQGRRPCEGYAPPAPNIPRQPKPRS